jgi:hypothetical protein
MDSCCTTHCTPTSNITTRITELRDVTAKDGIHFVEAGYKDLAVNCVTSLRALLSTRKQSDLQRHGRENYYWHSFRSLVGSSAPAPALLGISVANAATSRNQRGRGVSGSWRGRGGLAPRPYAYHLYKC